MIDITLTDNYIKYLEAIEAFEKYPGEETGIDIGRQKCICIRQAGGDPGYLAMLPAESK